MRKILSNLIISLLSFGCYFNAVGHKDIVDAQSAINLQNFKKAEKKLVSALRSDLSLELRIKALHQLGVVRAFHLNDLIGALKVFKETYQLANTPELKKRSMIYLADLYFSMLRDFEKSAPLYSELYQLEKIDKIKQKYFQRYIKALFENKNFNKVVEKLKGHDLSAKSVSILILKSLSLYFSENYLDSIKLLSQLELLQNLTKEQLSEIKFFKALILEDQQELRLSYSEYVDIFQLFPNSNLIKLRVDKLIHRKRSSKR